MDVNKVSQKELEEDFKVIHELHRKYKDIKFSVDDYKAKNLSYYLGLLGMNLNLAKASLSDAMYYKKEKTNA